MPGWTKHLRDSGKSVIDALVACAALALVACVVLPALSKERDDARIAQCADHLKQLAQAAHQYAADFEGKFFYNRSSKVDHNRQPRPELVGLWHDQERVGRYLDGEPMHLEREQDPHPLPPEGMPGDLPADLDHIGIGGGVFVCPSDTEDAGRSYDMNFWAGNGYSLDPDEKRPWPYGEFFDSNSPNLDQLLLFTDVLGFKPTYRGWVCYQLFGNQLLPGQRFGGMDAPYQEIDAFRRYGKANHFRTLLDYVRHGENEDRTVPKGAVNIAYANGHVGLRRSDQLFDSATKLFTYDTLWSLVDPIIEAPGASEP